MKKTLATLLAVLLLLVCLSACGGGNLFAAGPEATVQQFVDSINNNDVNGLAGCYEPSYQELVKASMNLLLSTNEGMTLAEMMGLGSEKLGLEVQNVAIDGDSATVTADISLGSLTNTTDLPLKQVDGKWYIDTAEVLNSFTSLISEGSSSSSESPSNIGLSPSSNPEAVVQQFIDAINSNDVSALARCFEPEYQELLELSFQQMEESGMSISLSESMGLGSETIVLTIDDVTIDGDYAIVTATISTSEYTETDEIPLNLVDGQWYIDAASAGLE